MTSPLAYISRHYWLKNRSACTKIVYSCCYSTSKTEKMYHNLQTALDEYDDVEFMPLRITSFILERAFSNAPLTIMQYLRDQKGNLRDPRQTDPLDIEKGIVGIPLIPFRSIFHNGFDALIKKLEKRHIDSPLLSFALETFTTGFLYEKDFQESCLQSVLKEDKEGHINVIMAIHLFSRLAANARRNYYVTNDLIKKYTLDRCPCTRNCKEEIIFDDTGIGSEFLWYGRPDIMILPFRGICGIVLPGDSDDANEDEEDLFEEIIGSDAKHTKQISGSLRTMANVQRIVSMAITFSMFQKKLQKKACPDYPPEVTLIPVIAANATHFDIYLYDSNFDILLRNFGPPIPLWEYKGIRNWPPKLNQSSIFKLWMAINHMSIQPLLSQADIDMLSGTCGLLSHFSREELEVIEDTLRMSRQFKPIQPHEYHFKYRRVLPS